MSDAILKRLREAARDIERLRDLLRKDGEDHARIVRDLTDRHERRITKYAEAIDKVKAAARRQALEEAAQIAEDIPAPGENPHAWPDRIAAASAAKKSK